MPNPSPNARLRAVFAQLLFRLSTQTHAVSLSGTSVP
jgi:hypothetical protein